MVKKLIESWRLHSGAQNSGAAAVELSFMLPVLLLLALGVSDYGVLTGSAASLESATRSVAEYARNSAPCAAGGLANSACISGTPTMSRSTTCGLNSGSVSTLVLLE